MIKYSPKKIYLFLFSIVILSSGWVIFYSIPKVLYFEIIFTLLVLFIEKPFSRNKLKCFVYFMLITLYAAIPYEFTFTFDHIHIIIIYSLLPFIFLLSDKSICILYRYLEKILLIILIPGIIFHILSLFNVFHISSITNVIVSDRYYYVFPFYVVEYGREFIVGLRFGSIFDEPGYLGTILAFILIINRLDFSKYKNYVFLLAGILTLSLAFYIIILTYYLFTFGRRKVYVSIIIIIVSLFFISLFWDVINDNVFERFKIEDGWITGDSRGGKESTSEMINYLFSQPPKELLFGNGYGSQHMRFDIPSRIADATWGNLFYQIGLIPFVYLLIFVLYYTRETKDTRIFGYLFIISIYQRPVIFSMLIIFLFVSSIIVIKTENTIRQ